MKHHTDEEIANKRTKYASILTVWNNKNAHRMIVKYLEECRFHSLLSRGPQ